jgi:sensor histidine kinase YesM
MNTTIEKLTVRQLQWLIWIAVSLIIFISLLPMDGVAQSAVNTLISTAFYAFVIYGNISLLFPKLYQRGFYFFYILSVIALLSAAGIIRGYLSWYLYYEFFSTQYQPFQIEMIPRLLVGGVLTFILSFIFRIALAYFELKKEKENIMLEKSKAELSLLKSQVQPHFLFNTLNNIYYQAYLEAPKTAELIGRLAEIMRYIVDDSAKEMVPVDKEVQFLENYIGLEQVRLVHQAELDFSCQYGPDLQIPPMLLITFVENIFKHGIDKSSNKHHIELKLVEQNRFLHFTAINYGMVKPSGSGSGLSNLSRRLTLLYGKNFEMMIKNEQNSFHAFFKIPLN